MDYLQPAEAASRRAEHDLAPADVSLSLKTEHTTAPPDPIGAAESMGGADVDVDVDVEAGLSGHLSEGAPLSAVPGTGINECGEEVIIPAQLARPILYGSQVMLGTAVVAAWAGAWAAFVLALGLWGTSVNFWRRPAYSWRRYLDYSMVAANIGYGIALAVRVPPPHSLGWFGTMAAVAVIFAANETRFWLNRRKTEWDYRFVVWVHVLGVHMLSNAAAIVLLVGVHENHGPHL